MNSSTDRLDIKDILVGDSGGREPDGEVRYRELYKFLETEGLTSRYLNHRDSKEKNTKKYQQLYTDAMYCLQDEGFKFKKRTSGSSKNCTYTTVNPAEDEDNLIRKKVKEVFKIIRENIPDRHNNGSGTTVRDRHNDGSGTTAVTVPPPPPPPPPPAASASVAAGSGGEAANAEWRQEGGIASAGARLVAENEQLKADSAAKDGRIDDLERRNAEQKKIINDLLREKSAAAATAAAARRNVVPDPHTALMAENLKLKDELLEALRRNAELEGQLSQLTRQPPQPRLPPGGGRGQLSQVARQPPQLRLPPGGGGGWRGRSGGSGPEDRRKRHRLVDGGRRGIGGAEVAHGGGAVDEDEEDGSDDDSVVVLAVKRT